MNINNSVITSSIGISTDSIIEPTSPDIPNKINEFPILFACSHCHQKNSRLSLCGRCKEVYYCGEKCQKAAWRAHQYTCLNQVLIPKEEEIVCKMVVADGVRDCTQREFKELLHSTFVTAPLFSKPTLQLIKNNPERKLESEKTIIESVAIYNQREINGYGVIALRDLKKNEIICSFGGKAIPKAHWDREVHSERELLYSVDAENFVLDPSTFTSLGAFINDGPPNAELKTLLGPKTIANSIQIPLDKVVVATRDISAGEIIYVDYGSEHGIKNGLYFLDEKAAQYLLQKFSGKLDVNLLNKTGWILSAIDLDVADTSDLVKAIEIEYILTTPYVLTLLHINGNLNPLETLENIQKLPHRMHLEFQREFDVASVILNALTKINDEEKELLLKIASTTSQGIFIKICQAFNNLHPQPSLEDYEIFGKALDRLRLLFFGSLSGSYWLSKEQTEFKKQFLSEKHQRMINDETNIQNLPKELKDVYLNTKRECVKMIQEHI